jgi:sugar phosphate isomerase/epimerase
VPGAIIPKALPQSLTFCRHAKDYDKEKKGPAPVGTGIVDFKRIFSNSKIAGMKHFFVEHDNPADPFSSITISYNTLNKILTS